MKLEPTKVDESGNTGSADYQSHQSLKEFTSTPSTASAYLAGSGGPERLPADDDDGPDTPETANTQGDPGRLYQLNR